MIEMINDCVATTLFPSEHLEAKQVGHVVMVKNRGELVPVKVVLGNDKDRPGDTVYLKSSDFAAPWAKIHFWLQGKENEMFMIVNMGNVVAIEKVE